MTKKNSLLFAVGKERERERKKSENVSVIKRLKKHIYIYTHKTSLTNRFLI